MTPGPTIIKKCPHCEKRVLEETIASGNTFGATYWTDGRRLAPMLPEPLPMVMCPHCARALWSDELEVLDEVEPWDSIEEVASDAARVAAPSMDQYLDVLDLGGVEPDRERSLRIRAWWAGNDARRDEGAGGPLTAREARNLSAIVAAMDESEGGDAVMKAEALRELGRFDEAVAVLARVSQPELQAAVEAIRELAARRDERVRELVLG